jgi:putative aldouronate transport system substrate-binding protein
MRKSIVALLALAMILSTVLAGCTTAAPSAAATNAPTSAPTTAAATETPVASAAAATDAFESDTGLPIVKEATTIKVITADNYETSASYASSTLPIFAELEKRTGVHVQFEVYADDYNSTVQTKLASGSDLPDLFMMPGTDPMKFASTGLIIPLDDLIKNDAPDIQKLYSDNPSYQSSLICPDGKQYTIATVMNMAPFNMPSIIIRQDWLDKLGLKAPASIDDWTTVLAAIKDKDPNGNGKKDEIPLCTYGSPFYMMEYFASAFGSHILESVTWEEAGWYVDANGKVQNDFITPATKDWIVQMNSWYKAGYFDAEMLSQNGDKWNAKILGNQAATAFTYSLNQPQWNDKMKTTYPGTNWKNIAPPSGPAGDGFYEIGNGLLLDHQFAISKDCKIPDTVMKWINYFYASPEGSTLVTWGIEGTDYTLVNGQPHYTDAILKSEKGSGSAIWARGITPNLPYILPKTHLTDRFAQYTDTANDMAAIAKYTKAAPVYALPTDAESSTYSNIMPNIKTYADEMIIKFILGKEPIANWDTYVSKITSMGLADVQTVKQAEYDRANKK